jgi:hypothetical protein
MRNARRPQPHRQPHARLKCFGGAAAEQFHRTRDKSLMRG